MADRGETRDHCPRCGTARHGGPCTVCGARAAAPPGPLVALPPGQGSPPGPSAVKLVREMKGPTVKDLMAAPDDVLEQLPGEVRAMADALNQGDLAEADLAMDRALGSLLRGPGYSRRRPSLSWSFLALVWFLGLAAGLLFWVGRSG